MLLRVCSILVTLLLMLGAAAPLAAQDDDADSEGSSDESGDDDEESYEEPDAWERPPMEEEKPAKATGDRPAPPPPEVGDGHPYMIGLLAGWGFKTDRSTGGLGADPYGLGLGVWGGYTFDFQLYVGLRYMYFLGSTESSDGSRGSPPAEVSANYMHIVAEAGYDLWAADLIIRPSVLIGAAMALRELKGVGSTESQTTGDLMLGPGFAVVYPMDQFFLGGDLRGNLVMGDGVSGVGLLVTGGARFQ